MQTLGKLEIPATPMVQEGSWGSRSIGSHASTMTLYAHGAAYEIEWDIPGLDMVEHIGLSFEHRRLIDYDGVFSLPREAIKLIRQCNFIVPRSFEDRD